MSLLHEQRRIAGSVTSSYHAKLEDIGTLQVSVESGNELLKEREKLKTELRACRQAIIGCSKKVELLALDEIEDETMERFV